MKQLGFIDVTDDKRLILKMGTYQSDNEKIDLRIYVKQNNDFVATKQGMSFSSEWLEPFMKLISKLGDV